jgi:hypothetical protein
LPNILRQASSLLLNVIPELNQKLVDEWQDYFPTGRPSEGLHYIGLPGSVEGGTATFLGFVGNESAPAFAVKVHRSRDAGPIVARESALLKKMCALGDPLSSTVPRCIYAGRLGGGWVLVQSIVDGRPMSCAVTSDGMPDIHQSKAQFHLVAQWLKNYDVQTRDLAEADAESGQNMARELIESYAKIYVPQGQEKELLLAVGKNLGSISRWQVQHGDLCRHNILMPNANAINVIDWTFCHANSPPLQDLFFFLATYFLQVRRSDGVEGFLEAFRYTFFEKSPYYESIRECLLDYCKFSKIEPCLMRVLFPIFLVRRAVWDYTQNTRVALDGPLPRFSIYLASLGGQGYHEAMKQSVWHHLFQYYANNSKQFLAE